MCVQLVCWILLAIFLPPVSVGLMKGLSIHLIINLLLCVFTLWLGASIHAVILVLTNTLQKFLYRL
jgi:uncharacterized membrane protein YqaE (UPF0057 family)